MTKKRKNRKGSLENGSSKLIHLIGTWETYMDAEIDYYIRLEKSTSTIKLYSASFEPVPAKEYQLTFLQEGNYLEENWKKEGINLLDRQLRKWAWIVGYPEFRVSGEVSEDEFEEIRMAYHKEQEAIIKLTQETPLIYWLKKAGLEPLPTGMNAESWKSKCPYSGGKHFLSISTKDDTWGCGYCQKKGNLKTLEETFPDLNNL